MTQRDDSGSQLLVPEAFVRLYSSPGGRLRPGIDRHTLAERHEYCEDLAAALAEQAATIAWRQGLSPDVVLDRIALGLGEGSGLADAAEAPWVLGRIAEMLEWPQPQALSLPGTPGPD